MAEKCPDLLQEAILATEAEAPKLVLKSCHSDQ